MKLKAKDKAKEKLLFYLSDPENDWPTRQKMSSYVLGYKRDTHIYTLFSVPEIKDIEDEGLILRRKNAAKILAKADSGLAKRASEGDPAAVKLLYQKVEGWIPTEGRDLKHDFSGELTERLVKALEHGKTG